MGSENAEYVEGAHLQLSPETRAVARKVAEEFTKNMNEAVRRNQAYLRSTLASPAMPVISAERHGEIVMSDIIDEINSALSSDELRVAPHRVISAEWTSRNTMLIELTDEMEDLENG